MLSIHLVLSMLLVWVELLPMKVLSLIIGIHVSLSMVSVAKLLSIVLEVMAAMLLATTTHTIMHTSSILVLITISNVSRVVKSRTKSY